MPFFKTADQAGLTSLKKKSCMAEGADFSSIILFIFIFVLFCFVLFCFVETAQHAQHTIYKAPFMLVTSYG
jgi:hypothetical protein